MKKKFFVSDINWDTDGKIVPELPDHIILELEDLDGFGIDDSDIADELSDRYGFCVNGFYSAEFDKEQDFSSSETGDLIVCQNTSETPHCVNVYDEDNHYLCTLYGYWLADIIDESALDYYRFIEDVKYYLPEKDEDE